jgi:peptidoglycan hydrolase-like protein with peptidoglycan-binding domain
MIRNRARWMAAQSLLAAVLLTVAGPAHLAAAQTNTTRKAAPKKARARRVARPRAQTAPTRDRIVEIQEALAREGFYRDKPSGRWDAITIQAMKDFQTSKGLTPTGKLGAQSLQKLRLGSEIAGLAAPAPQAVTRPSAMSESELNEPETNEPDADEPEATEP